MTDKDFWASIKSIEDGGFEPEGLKKLEYYADKFIGNQLVYKRFSPFEQHGCAEGGNVHVIASILAGAGVGTDKLTAPEGSFKRELQCGEIQEKRIEIWAKNVGCWIDDVETALPKQLGEMVAEGGEAKVYYHGASLIKTIGLDYFVLPVLALDRISLHNAYFPETKMIVSWLCYHKTRYCMKKAGLPMSDVMLFRGRTTPLFSLIYTGSLTTGKKQ